MHDGTKLFLFNLWTASSHHHNPQPLGTFTRFRFLLRSRDFQLTFLFQNNFSNEVVNEDVLNKEEIVITTDSNEAENHFNESSADLERNEGAKNFEELNRTENEKFIENSGEIEEDTKIELSNEAKSSTTKEQNDKAERIENEELKAFIKLEEDSKAQDNQCESNEFKVESNFPEVEPKISEVQPNDSKVEPNISKVEPNNSLIKSNEPEDISKALEPDNPGEIINNLVEPKIEHSNDLQVSQDEDRAKSSDTYDILDGTEERKFADLINSNEIPPESNVDILIIDQNEINEEEEELLSDKEIKSVQKEYEDEEFDDNDDVVVSPQRNLSADLCKPTRTGDSTKDEVSLS